MDDWKTFSFPFGMAYFQRRLLLVSGRVHNKLVKFLPFKLDHFVLVVAQVIFGLAYLFPREWVEFQQQPMNPYKNHVNNIPGPSNKCQMDGSWGATKQSLRFQTPPLGGCWYNIIYHVMVSIPWKSNRPPFFIVWFTSFTLLYFVRVYHHPKGVSPFFEIVATTSKVLQANNCR